MCIASITINFSNHLVTLVFALLAARLSLRSQKSPHTVSVVLKIWTLILTFATVTISAIVAKARPNVKSSVSWAASQNQRKLRARMDKFTHHRSEAVKTPVTHCNLQENKTIYLKLRWFSLIRDQWLCLFRHQKKKLFIEREMNFLTFAR